VNSMSANAAFIIQPLRFTAQGFSNGIFHLQFLGAQGSNYVLQASTNLVDWTSVATNPAITNVVPFLDPNTNYPSRFYRVLQQ
jgi:hypothetical protein